MENAQKCSGVFQLSNGNWGFRFRITLDGRVVDRKYVMNSDGKPFKTMQAASRARKIAIEREQKRVKDETLEQQRIQHALEALSTESRTFAEVYAEYCEKGRSDRAYATIRKQDSLWNIHLNKDFGNRYVDSFNVAEINDYLNNLYYNEGYAYRYVEGFLKMFYLIFGQAYSRNYLDIDTYNRLCRNKDTKIHMPKLKVDEDLEIVAFTNDECAVLDQHFSGTNAETAYLLGRYCGLRINEYKRNMPRRGKKR